MDKDMLTKARIVVFFDLTAHYARMDARWKALFVELGYPRGTEHPRLRRISLRMYQLESTMWKVATKYGPPRAEIFGGKLD